MSDDARSERTPEQPSGIAAQIPTIPKQRPTRTLPTNRISFANQLNLLRAYAAASDTGTKPVTNDAVASIAGMSPNTATLANGFFADVGFLQRSDGGYVPAPEVVSFQQVYQWDA